jgi:hypothetical protein
LYIYKEKMIKKKLTWKKGRGKLGSLQPLIGTWIAKGDSPMGKLICTRTFAPILNGKYIEQKATWKFARSTYEEVTIYGAPEGELSCWSFTSDGKRSQGQLADGTDIHPEAICIEMQVPAGIARMIFWPHEEEGFNWAVESKNKKGWNRFVLHHYTAV